MPVSIVWFRRDLRLDDLPALEVARAAAGRDGTVLPLFVLDPALWGPAGPNRRRFLAGALRELGLATKGALSVRYGDPRAVVPALAAAVGASVVAVTADFGPYGAGRDRAVAEALARSGAVLQEVGSAYAVSPGRVRAASGAPLRVFTAYRRVWEQVGWEAPLENAMPRWHRLPGRESRAYDGSGRVVPGSTDALTTEVLEQVAGPPAQPGSSGLPEWWAGLPLEAAGTLPAAGAGAAGDRLGKFISTALSSYARVRDLVGVDGTSRLSPYLHLGCIHPRTVLERLGTGTGAERLRSEVAWRDFYADVLWHRPASARRSLQPFGETLRWDTGARARGRFRAWATGQTGYPLVDAAMRQLLAEGWVHNRARMAAASFLVKDLHLDWRLGARWFMWHLVDGDLASNQHGWQWVAGTGTDAAPFYRVFNPTLQRERFDPDGAYVRRFVPELASAGSGAGGPDGPGVTPSLFGGGDRPGGDERAYPAPIVDHARERQEALDRFAQARRLVAKYAR